MSDMCTDNHMSCYSSFCSMKKYKVTDSETGDEKEIRADKPIEALRVYLDAFGLVNLKIKRGLKENSRYFVDSQGYIIY